MTDQETSVANFFETTLTAEMSPTDLTAVVGDTTGLSSPTFLVIEPDTAAQREVIFFDGTFTGTQFATTAIGNRYLSGSAAGSGLTHPVGSIVRSAPLAQHVTDLNDRIDADASAFTSHAADVDGHHTEDHAARHADGGADPLGAGSVDTTQLAAGAVTNPKMGAAAVDTAELADAAVETAKLADGAATSAKTGVLAVSNLPSQGGFAAEFEVDEHAEVVSQVLTGSFADVAAVTLAIPAGWNSWKCVAWATYTHTAPSGGSGTREHDVRVVIDGTAQQTQEVRVDYNAADPHSGAVMGRRTGMTTTGNRTVEFQGRLTAGDGITVADVAFYARAVRTS